MNKSQKLPENHLPWLDGLRGFAALWVLFSHVQILTGLKAYPILSWGELAVDLFMMLSGFLMAHHYIIRKVTEPWASLKTTLSFWIRRFFRIAPLYYVLLMLAFILGPWLGEYRSAIALVWPNTATPIERYIDQSAANILTHVSFIFGFLPNYAFRSPLPDWSIGLEMQFYLAFPLIMLTLFRVGLIKASIAIVFICLLFKVLFPEFLLQFQMPSFLPIKLYVFLIGIWIAISRDQQSMQKGLLFSLLIAGIWIIIEKSQLSVARAFLVIGMFYLMNNGTLPSNVLIANTISYLRKILSSTVSQFLGDTSYACYLLHLIIVIPVAGMLVNEPSYIALNAWIRFMLCLLISIPIIYITSWILYRIVEVKGIQIGKLVLRVFISSHLSPKVI